MNRKVLFQVAAPAVVIGLILLGTCLASAWYINQLQRNLACVLSQNVANLQAVQELELSVRQLRFHSVLYVLDRSPVRREPIANDHQRFEESLQKAKSSAQDRDQISSLAAIEAGYLQYRDELARLLATVPPAQMLADFRTLEDSHPIWRVVDPCHELLRNNQEKIEEISTQSARLGRQALVAILALGLGGTLGGLIVGYGIARGLSRSIYQLSVRVQDMAQRLDQDVASVRITADGDMQHLDQQLEHVVEKVEQVAQRLQHQQREMLRAEQLSAVGQLAASVAHEVRNPLTAINMLVEAALRPKNQKPLTLEDLRVIHREIARVEQTVQALLDFARLPALRRTACDLRNVISDAVELLRARADRQAVTIEVQGTEESVFAIVDPDLLRTVFVNLLLNALDAQPQGGRIAIDLKPCADMEVRIVFSDQGPGISEAMAKRLFTPFASTKPTGTGLGLSVSRRIIDEHGGRMSAANCPGSGASFSIHLPVQATMATATSSFGQANS